jgi:hypothetical protein
MSRTIGDRVGAILSANETTVKLLGYGTYEGEEVPPDGWMHDAEITNPKIRLDGGDVVWGYQCWWASEDRVKQMIGNRNVVMATIEQEGRT